MNAAVLTNLLLIFLLLGGFFTPVANGQSNQDPPRNATIKILMRNYQATPGSRVSLEATLVAARTPNVALPGRKLTFVVRWGSTTKTPWTMIGDAQTDDNGLASIVLTIPTNLFEKVPNGRVYIEVRFSGDSSFVDNVRYLKGLAHGWLYVSHPAISSPPNEDEENTSNPADTPTTTPAPKPSALPAPNSNKPVPQNPVPAETGGDGGDEPVPPSDEITPTADVMLTPILLRKVIGDLAGKEDAASVTSDMKLSPDAVPLVKDGFAISPPRFWFEARLEKLHSQDKNVRGVPLGIPIQEVEAVVTYRLVDTYTHCEWKGTERKRKDIPKVVGVFKPSPALDRILRPSAIKNSSGMSNDPPGSSTLDVNISQLIKTDDGQVLISALEQAVKVAREKVSRATWITDVLDVDTTTITLNSGSGANLKPGDRLEIKRYRRTITDSSGNARTVIYEPVGEIEVVRILEDYIEARVITGMGYEKGDLAFKNRTP